MRQNDVVKGVFIAVPLAVLCILYGLWLVVDTPVYMESMLVGGLLLLMFSLLVIRFVPRAFDYEMGEDGDLTLSTVQRTSVAGAREILRLVLMLALGRGIIMLGAFLWSLYLNGYTETALDIQHIWADHMFAERIISLANKGYAVELQPTSAASEQRFLCPISMRSWPVSCCICWCSTNPTGNPPSALRGTIRSCRPAVY